MIFAYLLTVTAESVPILQSKSLLIPELGYSSHTVAFHLIRTEWPQNCYLHKRERTNDILVSQHLDLSKSKLFIKANKNTLQHVLSNPELIKNIFLSPI